MTWRLVVAAPARRDLARLPEKVAGAVVRTFDAIAADPHRVGKPLQREVRGLWSARRGPYRVIYRVDDDQAVVTVLGIGHRADVYRRR